MLSKAKDKTGATPSRRKKKQATSSSKRAYNDDICDLYYCCTMLYYHNDTFIEFIYSVFSVLSTLFGFAESSNHKFNLNFFSVAVAAVRVGIEAFPFSSAIPHFFSVHNYNFHPPNQKPQRTAENIQVHTVE
jgi:hypothetical protein